MKHPKLKYLSLILGFLWVFFPTHLSAQNTKPCDPLTGTLKVPSLFSTLFGFNDYLALHSSINSDHHVDSFGSLDFDDIQTDSYGMNTNPQEPLLGRPRNHARGFQRVTNRLIHLFGSSYVQLGPVISIFSFD